MKYTTGLSFEITDDSTLTYGEKITFNAKALVNFATDGQTISGIATYRAQTAGETTFTLVYTGTNSSFFPEQTTKDLTVNIAPTALTAEGDGIASGTYGTKLSGLTVNGLTAKLGNNVIDGSWKIGGDENLEDQKLQYSWAAKEERAVQIPGLPEDLGKTVMTVITREDSENILAADSKVEYSEGKLIFTLGENTVEDIDKTAILSVKLQRRRSPQIALTWSSALMERTGGRPNPPESVTTRR